MPLAAPELDNLIDDLHASVFSCLPRADQRRKAMTYVRGLLEVTGRKSPRNMATQLAGPETDQSLHHFVCDSKWDWRPVRLAITRYLTSHLPPSALVVQEVLIPKAGARSVGVGRTYSPDLQQAMNAQRAIGIWAASPLGTSPVHWRLHLPRAWLGDGPRRQQAGIPDDARMETVSEAALRAWWSVARQPGLPRLPVVLNRVDVDTVDVARRLHIAGRPFLCRIDPAAVLTVADPVLVGHSTTLTAGEVARATRGRRRPASWFDARSARPHTQLLASTRVDLPGTRGGHQRGRGARLVALGQVGGGWPDQLWLADLDACAAELVQLCTVAADGVDHDLAATADRYGMRDYAGRSFPGWHRHMTLVSAAHAVATRRQLATGAVLAS